MLVKTSRTWSCQAFLLGVPARKSTLRNCGSVNYQRTCAYPMTQEFHSQVYDQWKSVDIHQKKCTRIFIEAVYIIAQIKKLPKCSSEVQWLNVS